MWRCVVLKLGAGAICGNCLAKAVPQRARGSKSECLLLLSLTAAVPLSLAAPIAGSSSCVFSLIWPSKL